MEAIDNLILKLNTKNLLKIHDTNYRTVGTTNLLSF